MSMVDVACLLVNWDFNLVGLGDIVWYLSTDMFGCLRDLHSDWVVLSVVVFGRDWIILPDFLYNPFTGSQVTDCPVVWLNSLD